MSSEELAKIRAGLKDGTIKIGFADANKLDWLEPFTGSVLTAIKNILGISSGGK